MSQSSQLDLLLLSHNAFCIRGLLGGLVALCLLLDVSATVLLRLAPVFASNGIVPPAQWTAAALLQGLSSFQDDTVDSLLLLIVRLLVTGALAVAAVVLGKPRLDDLLAGGPDDVCPRVADGTEPLIINAGPSSAVVATTTTTRAKLTSDVKEEHLMSFQRKEAAALRKNFVTIAIFIVSTICQVYLGIKCISFVGLWEEHPAVMTAQGVLMGVGVLLINVESFLVMRLINLLTAEQGHLVPEIHRHPLFFHAHTPLTTCDKCRAKTKQAYKCSLCKFDACPACFNKKDKTTGEGVLRGDKGARTTQEMSAFQYFRRGIKLILPSIPLFTAALFCLTLNSGVRLFMPNYQGEIMDAVFNARHACSSGPSAATDCTKYTADFQDYVLLYLLLACATGALSGLRQLAFMVVARRISVHARLATFSAIIKQDIAFFDGMRVGDLSQRLTGDIRAMTNPIFQALPTLLSNLVLLVGSVVMCFVTSWRLSMLAFTTILPVMHVTKSYAEWSGRINRDIFQHYSDGNSIANEAMNNIRTVRAVSSEEFELGRFGAAMALALKKGIMDAFFGALATSFNSYLDLGAGVLILWYGGTIAMSPTGSITVGELIKYQLYWNTINTSIQALNNVLNNFTRAAGAAERVLSLIDFVPDIPITGGGPVDTHVNIWSLRFDDVHFRYQMRPTNRVLEGLSFSVDAGKVLALVGKSGGGKSTIIHLLLRFYDPASGCVSLGGTDLRLINIPSFHRSVGVVAQDTQLFNCTILENITYALDPAPSQGEIVAACEAAQAHGFISEFEDGLGTKVGERGQRLSGGQKQRLAITRCLLRQPRLLLLDEATSALDAESEALVQRALDTMIWAGGHTVVLVAHRLSTVVNANAIVVVEQGRAVEQGTHAELLDRAGVYATLVSAQLQKQREQLSEGTS